MRRLDPSTQAAPLWTSIDHGSGALARSESLAGLTASQAEDSIAAREEQGYQDGVARGLAQAAERASQDALAWQQKRDKELAAARGQYDAARLKLEALMTRLSDSIDLEAGRAEELAIELAYAAVTRVLGSGYVGRDVMPALVREAMASIDAPVNRIIVSVADAGLVEDIEGIAVSIDPRMTAGQCRIETRLGSYDTGLDVRLDRLRQALLSGLADHHAEQR